MDTEPDEIELPRGIALAWGVAAHPQQRGPKRELSLERIVDVAVEIADADGLGAVSMAAVAKRLGFTTMSLYRYVTRKDDLLLLMGEAALGVPPLTVTEAPTWREGMIQWYRETLAVHAAHPWMLDLPIDGIPSTPANLAWMDAALGLLEDTPLEPLERVAVMLTMTGHARWTAHVERGYEERARAEGVSPEDLDRQVAHIVATLVTPEQFPALRQAIDAGVFTAHADPFAFGLERILDGVKQYVQARSEGAPASVPTPSEDADTDAFPKDPRVRAARSARREAQKAVREAEKKLREAVKREQEAVGRARERQAKRGQA
ncbi:TetR/AcrR family transcriptional regulator C-terminal domain-containing protein [Ruania alkalisoli]|uniref:TetR/AcrR family transcriptional regulator C-terminal domain-containing protein n=1 Tax=Ruania alkalisoli TaxID=2779775 RepID=A0A7M1SZ29_9MICO|nr:TetR/AcrR family transcriptional regulator [Ruania alkalisoli]QOR71893.1 TetR/AcrR family transcriptional regulator C-terminal domain-containing protein [Ruania alkalisoli]